MSKIKISFFGSSEFSIPTLKKILENDDFELTSIITMPPAKKNRGKKLSNNIVYDFAINCGFNKEQIFTPNSLKHNNDIVNILKNQGIDFIIVVAYGKIITKEIIAIPNYEILNLHPSSLPKYRGAAPIERAIENGDEETEICIMKVDVGLDTGDVAVRKKYILDKNRFADEIVADIAENGSNLMVETIKKTINGNVVFEKQNEEGMIYANKIEKQELFLDLTNTNLDAISVYNKIRAFNASGCCYFLLDNLRVKIIKAELEICENSDKCGFDKTTGYLFFKNGIIKPTVLQKEGKNPLQLKDFLNGIR